MVVTALEITLETEVAIVLEVWEMVEEEKAASIVVGTVAEKTEKRRETEIEKWLEDVASAQMKEDGMKTPLFIVMATDVTLPYTKVSIA